VVSKLVVIDVRGDYVRLPNGKRVPRDRVISIDYEKGVIVYIDRDGSIKTERFR